MKLKIYCASDHAGVALKQQAIHYLNQQAETVDLGPHDADIVDYPIYANKLAAAMKPEPNSMGLLICGSGIGMTIAANRLSYIRAANCLNIEMAELARQHNDANVLVLGARMVTRDTAIGILEKFITTPFSGGRHKSRVDMLEG